MLRILKMALLTGLAVAAAIVTAIVVLLLLVDPDDHRERIASLLEQQSGMDVQLAGPVALSLYPWVGFTVADVSVTTEPGAPFAHIEHARARARLLPLLMGRYQLDTFQLFGASLNLVIDEQGRGNWETGPAADSSRHTGGAPQWPAILAVGGVDIRDTRVTFDDRRRGRQLTIEDLTARTGALLDGAPVDISVSAQSSLSRPELRIQTTMEGVARYDLDGAQYRIEPLTLTNRITGPAVPGGEVTLEASVPVSLDGEPGSRDGQLLIGPVDITATSPDAGPSGGFSTLRLQTQVEYDGASETLTVPYFTLSGAGIDLEARLDVSDPGDSPSYQGQLYMAGLDLQALSRRLGIDLPPTRDEDVFRHLAFQTTMAGSGERLFSRALELQLDESTVTGELDVDLTAAIPLIELDLQLDRIDVDRYLPPVDGAPMRNTGGPPLIALPLALLQTGNVRGELTADRFTIAGMQLESLRSGYEGTQTRLQLSPFETLLYGGRLTGEIGAEITDGATILVSGNTRLQAVNVAPLLRDVAGATTLSGLATMELSMSSRGGSTQSLRANLTGDGEILLQNGELYGISVGETLAQLETMIRRRRLMSLQAGDRTPFDEFSATLDIRQGVIRSNDLRLLAPGFRVSGRGILLDLNNERIDYDLDATVDPSTAISASQSYDIGGYSVPINCGGTVRSPVCTPDVATIIRRALGNAIEQQLGDFLQRLSQ